MSALSLQAFERNSASASLAELCALLPDGVFDQLDIVQILQADRYRTGQPAANRG